jgi:hypothetical protein
MSKKVPLSSMSFMEHMEHPDHKPMEVKAMIDVIGTVDFDPRYATY